MMAILRTMATGDAVGYYKIMANAPWMLAAIMFFHLEDMRKQGMTLMAIAHGEG